MRHWYLSLCMGGVWSAGWSYTPTSRPEANHTEWQIPVSHRYRNFSLWWAHVSPKQVRKLNKYTKQICAPKWIYLQDCTRMHGLQNIKFPSSPCYLHEPTFKFCLVYLFIFSTCFGQPCAHHKKKLLYLCDTGICHSVWVASGLLVGV